MFANSIPMSLARTKQTTETKQSTRNRRPQSFIINQETRNWCYTLNNYTLDDLIELYGLFEEGKCNYHVIGFEVGENGTPHVQGYINMKSSKKLSMMKNGINNSAHWEPMYATPSQASEYCKEDDDYIEQGTLPVRGAPKDKVDTQMVMDAINDGKTRDELRKLFPKFCLYHQSKIDAWYDYEEQRKEQKPTKFYLTNRDDPLTTVVNFIEHYKIKYPNNTNTLAVVTDLSELDAYPEYDHVLYLCDYYNIIQSMWPRGTLITYKVGYQVKTCKPITFTISTNHMDLYDKQYFGILNEDD